jgi:hypothetical protein
MESVPNVRQAFFPLDEELGLQPGSLTPRQQEHLVHLSLWMPFRRAVKLLDDVTGVQVSEATGRRQTEAAGAAYEALQNEQADQLCGVKPKKSSGSSSEIKKRKTETVECPDGGAQNDQKSHSEETKPKKSRCTLPETKKGKAETAEDKLLISSDGAMVPLVGGDYVEAKTLVIGRVQAKEKRSKQRPDQHVETVDLSYFSRLADAETFGRRAIVETERRGVSLAGQVCAVQDGAEWIQGFVDLHASDAVRILDFAHARGYLAEIAELVREAGTKLPAHWLESQCHQLKHQGPTTVLQDIGLLLQKHPDVPELETKVNYLRKRERQMQYPLYQQLGWPLGSGSVESSHKSVVQARLKGAGMRWERSHVNPMLALRTQVCHDRWDEAWVQTTEHRGQQRMHKRLSRHQMRRDQALHTLQQLIVRMVLLASPLLPKSAPPQPPSASSAPSASSRPAPNHPWRRRLLAKK